MYVVLMAAADRAGNVHRRVRNASMACVRFLARQVVQASNAATMGAAVYAAYVLGMGFARISLVAAIPTAMAESAAMMAAVDRVVNAPVDKHARNRLAFARLNVFPIVPVNSAVPMAAAVHAVHVQTIKCVAIRNVWIRGHVFPIVMAKCAGITDVADHAENVATV